MKTNIIIQGDALTELKNLLDESIDCIMTSPPYWNLRDYGSSVECVWDGQLDCEHVWNKETTVKSSGGEEGSNYNVSLDTLKASHFESSSSFCTKCNAWKGQLGLEPSFDLYLKHLLDIFDEVKRVLKKEGTCFVNLGDTYWGGGHGGATEYNIHPNKTVKSIKQGESSNHIPLINWDKSYQSKCLCLIPERFVIGMVERDWILRNIIIWHKTNAMPSSIKDRFSVDFEQVFFFVKSKKYYFEPQYEPLSESYLSDKRPFGILRQRLYENSKYVKEDYGSNQFKGKATKEWLQRWKKNEDSIYGQNAYSGMGRNKRCVWSLTNQPFPEAHFATFPEILIETPIKAGCPELVCSKCNKAKKQIIATGNNENSFNMRVRDVKEERMKFKDRVASEDEIQNYDEKNYVSEGKEYTVSEGCNCQADFVPGVVLDPFFGAGTTGLVALKQNRAFIGLELNPSYCEIARKRLKPWLEQTKLPIIKL